MILATSQGIARHLEVTCDAFMADVVRRTRLQLRHRVELYSGRRGRCLRLRDRLSRL
jgi:hypothetical protein